MEREAEPERTQTPQHVDDLAIDSAKTLLRKAVILRRDLRPAAQRKADDAARFELIRRRMIGALPRTVAAYLSTGSEPGTLQLVGWLAALDIRVLLPVLTDPGQGRRPQVAWARYAGPDALRVGVSAILEPTTPIEAGNPLSRADLVICPALAANAAGDRLGRGGGWYDRALVQAEPTTEVWTLLNDDEVLEAIPTQPWDRSVGAIVTPSRVIECRPRPTE